MSQQLPRVLPSSSRGPPDVCAAAAAGPELLPPSPSNLRPPTNSLGSAHTGSACSMAVAAAADLLLCFSFLLAAASEAPQTEVQNKIYRQVLDCAAKRERDGFQGKPRHVIFCQPQQLSDFCVIFDHPAHYMSFSRACPDSVSTFETAANQRTPSNTGVHGPIRFVRVWVGSQHTGQGP